MLRQIADTPAIGPAWQTRCWGPFRFPSQIQFSAVVLFKRRLDVGSPIDKIKYKNLLPAVGPVDARQGLNGLHRAGQLLVHIENAQLCFIKARLQFIRHNDDPNLVMVFNQNADIILFGKLCIHRFFGELDPVQLNRSGKRHH